MLEGSIRRNGCCQAGVRDAVDAMRGWTEAPACEIEITYHMRRRPPPEALFLSFPTLLAPESRLEASTMATITTPVTKLFKIKHPIILAGMNVAAGPELAAAVTNAGGLGVIGGVGYTPKILRAQIKTLKDDLVDKNAPFGVDLLLPQVGGNARKTNYDYTRGQLPDLLDVIIDEKASLFVCAVGVPPKWVVDKLHKAGIPVMNVRISTSASLRIVR
ncbi:hypothetical protein NUW54_g9751 [Trametes sanguinea]|uniref:Uncharacterized protein n=1 Tax=Trametes sanguinea TaxID=158606 RepID=A0ACC1P603_9APHY|nr:hypothetical protein NUW54_g9751 [Trametes sanguinea]